MTAVFHVHLLSNARLEVVEESLLLTFSPHVWAEGGLLDMACYHNVSVGMDGDTDVI